MARTKEEYLREKGRLPKEDFGSIFCFRSDRNGVEEIKELLIWDKTRSSGTISSIPGKVGITRMKFKEAPYECSIWDTETIGHEDGYGSGVGDLWSWSYYFSFDREALEQKQNKEAERIEARYGNSYMTLRKFAQKCLSYKEELLDVELVIVAPNGMEFEPQIKFRKKDIGNFDLTKENVEFVVITPD